MHMAKTHVRVHCRVVAEVVERLVVVRRQRGVVDIDHDRRLGVGVLEELRKAVACPLLHLRHVIGVAAVGGGLSRARVAVVGLDVGLDQAQVGDVGRSPAVVVSAVALAVALVAGHGDAGPADDKSERGALANDDVGNGVVVPRYRVIAWSQRTGLCRKDTGDISTPRSPP